MPNDIRTWMNIGENAWAKMKMYIINIKCMHEHKEYSLIIFMNIFSF